MKATKTYRVHPFARNGSFIRHAREQLVPKPSQETFAAQVGTTRRHMIRLENGEHLPSAALRDRIAEATGVSRETIISSDDDEEAASMPLSRDEKVARLSRMLVELLEQA